MQTDRWTDMTKLIFAFRYIANAPKTKCKGKVAFCPSLTLRLLMSYIYIYRVSQEEGTKFRESVPYVKIYRYNPKHLYPKLNRYGDNGQRKVWSSGGSTPCTCQLSRLIDVCPWVWCPIQLTLAVQLCSRLIPECTVSHVTSVLAFMSHV